MDTLTLTDKEQAFIAAYFEAVYFTDTGDLEQAPGDADLCPMFERESVIDCLAFLRKFDCYMGDDERDTIAHYFWYTRNGHGVGFWDGEINMSNYILDWMDKYSKAVGETYSIFEGYND